MKLIIFCNNVKSRISLYNHFSKISKYSVLIIENNYKIIEYLHNNVQQFILIIDYQNFKNLLKEVSFKKKYLSLVKEKTIVLLEKDEIDNINFIVKNGIPYYTIKSSKYLNVINNFIKIIEKRVSKEKENNKKYAELETNLENFKKLFNGISAVMIIVDSENWKIVNANKAAINFYKKSLKKLREKPFYEINCIESNCSKDFFKNLSKKNFNLIIKLDNGLIKYIKVLSSEFYFFNKKYYVFIIYDITKNKKIELTLKENEKFNKVLFHSSHIPMVVMDSKTYQYIDFNKAALRIYGYKKKEELLGKTPVDVSAEFQYDGTPSSKLALIKIKQAMKKRSIIFEWKHKRPNGEYWDGEVHLMTFTYKGKKYLKFSLLDITDRKKIQNQLKESEERYRAAFQTSPDIVAISDLDGKYIDVNKSFLDITKFKRKDVIGKTSIEIGLWKNPEDRKKLLEILRKKGSIKNLEMQFNDKNGKVLTGLISAKFINLNGKTRILSITRDITKRKEAEKQILNERERLLVTLRSIGDGVITTDIKGRITLMNKAAEQITGWKFEKVVLKHYTKVLNLIDGKTYKRLKDPVKSVLTTKSMIEIPSNTILVSKNNEKKLIADSAAPIKDNDGNLLGVVIVFRDVTEKMKFLEASSKNQKLEALGILAGGIAHDFNNLLAGIYSFIDLALGENKNCKENSNSLIKEYLEDSLATIDKARNLTTQLLTFAKGGLPSKQTEDLVPFIKKTSKFALSGSNIKIEYDIDSKLWMVDIDKNQIEQVIDNIIINAKQAMKNGGKISISLKNIYIDNKKSVLNKDGKTNSILKTKDNSNLTKNLSNSEIILKKGRYVKISIKDTGTGIPHNILQNIFDPFFTTKENGHGLGLAISYSIIKKHDGQITVESEVGKGTTFNIFLPASRKKSKKRVKLENSEIIGNGKVIIMEDEKTIRFSLKKILESKGFEVIDFSKGEDVIDFIKENKNIFNDLKCIILDLTVVGGMGGKETIKAIRSINKNIPVFVASGYASDPIISNPTKYGFTDSISKPYLSSDLFKMISKYIK